MTSWLLPLVLLLLAAASWMWYRGLADATGLPAGDVIYSDSGDWFTNDEVLAAPNLRLSGKPDYLVQQRDGMVIPVEVKSSVAPAQPYESHLLQLAAYCALVEATYGIRPSHGIIQYRDQAFAVDYTYDLEEDLLDIIADMRQDMVVANVNRSHNDWNRCARCGLRGSCEQRLD